MTNWIDANERLPGWYVDKIWAWRGRNMMAENPVALKRTDDDAWMVLEDVYQGTVSPVVMPTRSFTHWMPYEPPAPPEESE